MISQLLALEGVRLRTAYNRIRNGGSGLLLLIGGGLLILTLFLYGEYRFFLKVFVELDKLEDFPRFFVIRVLERLHNMIFLTSFSMMLFSSLITSVSTTYLATDLQLLHSAPLGRITIFLAKLLETLLLSSYMVWLVTLPIFIAFGSAFGSAVRTGLWSAAVLVVYSIPPVAIGALAALVLMRFVPARRAHQVLTGLGLLGAVLVVVVLRSTRPERLLNPGSGDDLIRLLASISIPQAGLLPSTWASVAIVSSLQGLQDVYFNALLKLMLLAIPILGALIWTADASYFRAFSRSGEGAPASGRQADLGLAELLRRTVLRASRPSSRAVYLKDVRTFTRDSAQWSQLLLIAALIFVYLFNIRNLPFARDFPWLGMLVSYLNLGLTGFILAAIAVRYAYPAVSLEGQSFWVIRASPVDYRRLLFSKLILHLVPFLLLAEVLVISGNYLLKSDRFMVGTSIFATATMTLGLTGLGIGMGAQNPRFRFESPAQVAAGMGGITYMVLALAFICLILGLLFVPVYQHVIQLFPPRIRLPRLELLPLWSFYAAVATVSALVAYLPMRRGLQRLSVPRD